MARSQLSLKGKFYNKSCKKSIYKRKLLSKPKVVRNQNHCENDNLNNLNIIEDSCENIIVDNTFEIINNVKNQNYVSLTLEWDFENPCDK